jgi:hypothetical protein
MLEFDDKEEARDDLLLFRYSVIGFDPFLIYFEHTLNSIQNLNNFSKKELFHRFSIYHKYEMFVPLREP